MLLQGDIGRLPRASSPSENDETIVFRDGVAYRRSGSASTDVVLVSSASDLAGDLRSDVLYRIEAWVQNNTDIRNVTMLTGSFLDIQER